MADLTEEEIADYRGLLRDGAADVIGAVTITRLLDEVERSRTYAGWKERGETLKPTVCLACGGPARHSDMRCQCENDE